MTFVSERRFEPSFPVLTTTPHWHSVPLIGPQLLLWVFALHINDTSLLFGSGVVVFLNYMLKMPFDFSILQK